MNRLVALIKVELIKIFSSKAWWIVTGFVIVLQPLFAVISAREIVIIGLNATPETVPNLAQAIPPVAYIGFDDIVNFGLLPMVVFGGLMGAKEYRNHNLRVTLLCSSKRSTVFMAKFIAMLTSSMIISSVSIYFSIVLTHVALGEFGLNPVALSPITWAFIVYSICAWTLLTLLGFLIGIISRNTIVPFLFLVPQVYGLASYLASNYRWGEYLPVAASQLMIATPTGLLIHNPIKGGLLLGAWAVLLSLVAGFLFLRRDVGSVY